MKNITSYNSFINESKLQNDYREFFSKMLEFYGVKSPAEFKNSKDVAEKFYSDIKKGWTNGEGISKYGKELIEKFEKEGTIKESLDGEELLSPKQRGLSDGLKKSIIARLKKSGKKVDKECEDDECEDDKCKDGKCKDGGKKDKKIKESHDQKFDEDDEDNDDYNTNGDSEYTLPSELWDSCISKFLDVSNNFPDITVDVVKSNVIKISCDDEEMVNDLIGEFEQINPEYITEYDENECIITIDDK